MFIKKMLKNLNNNQLVIIRRGVLLGVGLSWLNETTLEEQRTQLRALIKQKQFLNDRLRLTDNSLVRTVRLMKEKYQIVLQEKIQKNNLPNFLLQRIIRNDHEEEPSVQNQFKIKEIETDFDYIRIKISKPVKFQNSNNETQIFLTNRYPFSQYKVGNLIEIDLW